MNANINCTLKGQYKVDLYSGNKLVESIDWFSNDITNYGMTYPFDYSFAQCFMFLSIGDQKHNTLNNNPNTGLKNPITGFKVYNPDSGIHYQSGEYIGWQGYEIGGEHNASYQRRSTTCGSKITKNGINLYRGWSIPTGNLEYQTVIAEPNGLLIKQLMVSPSSGSDLKGNKAFSIVDRDILIPSGYNAVITYQLSINFKDYENLQFFSGKDVEGTNGYFNTGNAETGKNGSELNLLSGWSNLSGIYRLIFPAIQFVDDIGACVSPKIGYDLEPYTIHNKKSYFYLSPDISHFMVNKSGKIPSSEYEAYNQDGLMGNYSDIHNEITIYSVNQNPSSAFGENADKWFYSGESLNDTQTNELELIPNIRLEQIPSISNYNSGSLSATTFSYKTSNYIGAKNYPVAFATPGKLGFNNSYSDFGQKAVFSTFLRRLPVNPTLYETGLGPYQRSKFVTKKAIFSSLYSYGYNSRYGSLVLGRSPQNTTIEQSNFYPYLDFLFFDTEGRASNMAHYRYIPHIYLEDRGSGIGRARFDILEITTGISLSDIDGSNNIASIDPTSHLPEFNRFDSNNNGISKFALYGYKNISGQKLISNPRFYQTEVIDRVGVEPAYNIFFNWNSSNEYDGYYVLIHDLPQLGIQSLNLKSGITIFNQNTTNFTIGYSKSDSYVENVGYLEDFTKIYEEYLQYPFKSGKKPESINRFYSASGFMGNGIPTSLNESGINFLHPRLLNTVPGTNNLTSGFLFPGQILNENVLGNINYNNNTGYGSVYGVVADSIFYSKNYDICLLDKPDWTGFGDPNPTGYATRLCWPYHKNKIRLGIDVGYFLSGSGIIEDSQDYFADGRRQIINDIIVKGNNSFHNQSFLNPLVSDNFCLSGEGDGSKTLFKNINQSFKFRVEDTNSKTFDIDIILKSGLISQTPKITGVFFSGFPTGFSLKERGSGIDINLNSVIQSIKILSGQDTKEYKLIADCLNPLTTSSGSLYVLPTNFKKPIGHIYHLETGYRISPNYSIANTGKINKYLPITGGSFPGLSTENALEIYLTLNWKSE